jgi:pyridoxamine 5'-phosphate oxidase
VTPETTSDPWSVFEQWHAEAKQTGLPLPEAMTLATVGADGRPAARVVLYKGRQGDALTFFTNYESRKGRDLAAHPWAALVFHWASLERQVRIEGPVHALSAAASDEYFATRPRDSQIGAWASAQSEALPSRAALESAFARVAKRYQGQLVPRPPHWGGYAVVPDRFEFWLSHVGRLNDRVLFSRGPIGWERSLLSP